MNIGTLIDYKSLKFEMNLLCDTILINGRIKWSEVT